jgi:hypothetical protein
MTSLTEVMSEQLASDLQSKESGPESAGIRRQNPADIVTDEEDILLEDEIGNAMYQ